jgi:thermitase
MRKKTLLVSGFVVTFLVWFVAFAMLSTRLNSDEAAVPTLRVMPDAQQAENPAVTNVPDTELIQGSEQQAPIPNEVVDSDANSSSITGSNPTDEPGSVVVAQNSNSGSPIISIAGNSNAVQPEINQPNVEPVVVTPPEAAVPNQIVLRFDPDSTVQQREDYVRSIGGTIVETIDALNTIVVDVPATVTMNNLPTSSIVTVSEPNFYASALIDVPTSDPYYESQYALPIINAPEAWLAMPEDASTVKVAVIDSGICSSHPDLQGRILAGWDFVQDDDMPQDEMGHGCGVAGIIAANIDNGIGIAGVAPNAQIIPLRVLDARGVGTYADVAAAMVWAADNGAQIINLSLGGASPSSVLEDAVNYVVARDVWIIAAAGNTGTTTVLYPAAYEPVIAVGSVDSDLQPSSFSSTGQIDLWAPGRDIWTLSLNGGYTTMSGTSFAAPYVAGIAALNIANGQQLYVNGEIINIGSSVGVDEPTPSPTVQPTIRATESLLNYTIDFNNIAHVPEYLQPQVYDAVVRNSTLLPHATSNFVATSYRLSNDGNWARIVLIPDYVIAAGWENFAFNDMVEILLERGISGNWVASLYEEENFQTVIQGVPSDFINFAALEVSPASSVYRFPWTTGRTWNKNGGWHDDGYPLPENNAIDFKSPSPDDIRVVAAQVGLLDWICDTDSRGQAWVKITTTDGATGYGHLQGATIDDSDIGQIVGMGEHIGDLFSPYENYDDYGGCGYGSARHLHFVFPNRNIFMYDLATDQNVSASEIGINRGRAVPYTAGDISGLGEVGGIVVNESGIPISGAVVSASLGGAPDTTNPEGIYVLHSVPSGYNTIEANHPSGFGIVGLTVITNSSQQAPTIVISDACFQAQSTVSASSCDPTDEPPDPPLPPDNPGSADYVIAQRLYPSNVSPGQQFHPEITVCLYNGASMHSGDMLRNVDGNQFGAYPHVEVVGTVNSGSCYVFRFYNNYPITAPMQDGTYISQWKLWVNGAWVRGTEVVIEFTVGSGGEPNGPIVILHDNSNYDGEQRGYGKGRHDIGGTNFNDRATSVSVPDGWSARLYEQGGLEGSSTCITENTPDLPAPFANGVSSLHVFSNSTCFDIDEVPILECGGVILHEGGGRWLVLMESDSNLADNNTEDINWNDKARWIEVIGPWRATGYDNENFQSGSHGPFTSGINSVGTNVTSVRIERTRPCEDTIPPEAPSYCFVPSNQWGVFIVKSNGTEKRLTFSLGNLAVLPDDWNDRVSAMYVVGPYRAWAYDNYYWEGSNHGEVNQGTGLRENLGSNVTSIRVELRLDCANPPLPPQVPVNFNITATLDSITMTWNDVADENGYRVYRWNGTSFVQVAELGANVTTFTDTGLSCAELYYYEVSAFNGNGESSHTLVQADCVPNDSPQTAINVASLPSTNTQATNGAQASDGAPTPLCGFNVGRMVWYRYTASSNGVVHISTAGTDFDTVLAIYTGEPSSLTEIICNDDEGVIELSALGEGQVKPLAVSDFFGLTSFIDLRATAGTTYYIMIGGYNSMGGNLVFTMTPNEPPVVTVDVASITVNESETATNSGFVGDPEGDLVALSASAGSVVNNGDGTWSWSFTTSDGPIQTQTVFISGDDGNGGSTQISFNLLVNNVAPTAVFANTSGIIPRGGTAILAFSNSADVSPVDTAAGFYYSVDCTNDGIFEMSDSTTPSFACTYADSGSYTVLGRIKDKDGGFSDYTAVVKVNTPPTVTVTQSSVVVNEGETASNTISTSDADGDTVTVIVSTGVLTPNGIGFWNWNFPTNDGPIQSQMVTVFADDGNGGTAQATFNLTVNNVVPSVNAGADITLISGETLNVSAFFTDPGTADTHTATIDFGTGMGAQLASVAQGAGSGTVTGGQVYFELGQYTITVCVTDDDLGGSCDSFLLQVIPLPVAIDIRPGSPQNTVNLGSNGNVQVAILSAPGFDATTVDPLSVRLSSAAVHLRGNGTPQTNTRDVNGDGVTDLVVHVDTEGLQLSDIDIQAILTGRAVDGRYIEGTDMVRIVP